MIHLTKTHFGITPGFQNPDSPDSPDSLLGREKRDQNSNYVLNRSLDKHYFDVSDT